MPTKSCLGRIHSFFSCSLHNSIHTSTSSLIIPSSSSSPPKSPSTFYLAFDLDGNYLRLFSRSSLSASFPLGGTFAKPRWDIGWKDGRMAGGVIDLRSVKMGIGTAGGVKAYKLGGYCSVFVFVPKPGIFYLFWSPVYVCTYVLYEITLVFHPSI